jgi:hypothetical protein
MHVVSVERIIPTIMSDDGCGISKTHYRRRREVIEILRSTTETLKTLPDVIGLASIEIVVPENEIDRFFDDSVNEFEVVFQLRRQRYVTGDEHTVAVDMRERFNESFYDVIETSVPVQEVQMNVCAPHEFLHFVSMPFQLSESRL